MKSKLTFCLFAVLVLQAPSALAQSYRCVGADGKKHYGQTVPPQCAGVTVEQLNAQGGVVRRIEPTAPAAQKGAVEATSGVSKDEVRKNKALLASYASEKDIETARQGALRDPLRAIGEAEARIASLEAKRAPDYEVRAQRDLVSTRKREVDAINARYDGESKRYRELASMDPRERAEHLGMEKGVTVKGKQDPYADTRNRADAQRQAARDRAELQRLQREQASRPPVHVLGGSRSTPTAPSGGRIYCNGGVIDCQRGEAVSCGNKLMTCQ